MTRYWAEIVKTTGAHKLDPLLVEAIVVQESQGNADYFRFERDFWNRYLKLLPAYVGANPRRVSAAYGLMGVMYPTALEVGYKTEVPPEMLFCPEIGLEYGCRQLRRLVDWADSGYPQVGAESRRLAVLASYSGGRGGNTPGTPLRPAGRVYALSTLAHLDTLRRERGM